MEYTIVAKPDGTIEVVPVEQVNNLPFSVGERLFNEFNMAGAVPNITPFNPKSLQSIFPTNVQKGITASSAAVPFGTDVDRGQGFTEGSPSDESFPGANFQFLPSAIDNQTADEKEEESGLATLLEFLAPGSLLGKVLPQESPEVRATKDFYRRNYGLTPTGQVASGIMAGYNPVSGGFLNFITGGRYGDPMNIGLQRAYQKRINMISKNLDKGIYRDPATKRKQLAELQKLKRQEQMAMEKPTIDRARERNRSVYETAGKEGRLGPGGGFSTSGREGAFSSKTGRGRQDY